MPHSPCTRPSPSSLASSVLLWWQTSADTAIMHDQDFNPEMDRQAEDRCHRVGQVRTLHPSSSSSLAVRAVLDVLRLEPKSCLKTLPE